VCRVETCLGPDEIARLLGGGVFHPPDGLAAPASTVSVTELMERYLEHKLSLSWAPEERTLRDYRQYLRDHVRPHAFGELPVLAVTGAGSAVAERVAGQGETPRRRPVGC